MRFTLSAEQVHESMASMNVLSFEERYGIFFFVSKSEDYYVLDVFVRSTILPRFRHHGQHMYTNDLATVVPGSRYYILVVVVHENIFLDDRSGPRMEQRYTRRISFIQIITLIMLQFSTAGLLCDLYLRQVERRKKPAK